MKSICSIILLLVFMFPFQNTSGQEITREVLIKNLFLMEPWIIKSQEEKFDLQEFYNAFDFKIFEIGDDSWCKIMGLEKYYVLDSFKVSNTDLIREEFLKDSVYIVAINGRKVYRLKGFSCNDFPFLMKFYLEENEKYSVKEILQDLNRCYNTNSNIYIDFECLYEAFRSKEINYDKFPCLESYPHSKNICVQIGYNEKVCVKSGGESIGYRGTKYKKSKYRK
ncbi:MAG: hypothetical protein IJ916_13130 [Paludibacteraceae bacterium]|nr:hypothetical protein [Paludibacteraceae bacterium]